MTAEQDLTYVHLPTIHTCIYPRKHFMYVIRFRPRSLLAVMERQHEAGHLRYIYVPHLRAASARYSLVIPFPFPLFHTTSTMSRGSRRQRSDSKVDC